MRLTIRRAVLLSLLLTTASAAFAQIGAFATAFPVTNTRYGRAPGAPLLRSNGHDALLFWVNNELRVTRLGINGESRLGRPVFDMPMDQNTIFDVVWTGAHFVVAATDWRNGARILGRIVDATGQPIGLPFTIAEGAANPRLAFNGKSILMVYFSVQTQSLLLTPDGLPAGTARPIGGFLSTNPVVASNGTGFAAILSGPSSEDLVVFDANGVVRGQRSIAVPIKRWALASDGHRYLAVSISLTEVTTSLFEGDGSGSNALSLDISAPDQASFRHPDVIWTGTRWMVTYGATPPGKSETRFVELDPEARSVLARNKYEVADTSTAWVENRAMVSWPAGDAIYTGEFPLAFHPSEPGSFGARQQHLLASAASNDGTLIVWQETGDGRLSIRAGVRTRDGRWREREIADAGQSALAASDGHDFVVIVNDVAIRLDQNGAPQPNPTTAITTFHPSSMTWSGINYTLAGIKDGSVVTALLTPGGVVSAPVVVPFTANVSASPLIAANSSGFYVAWFIPGPCFELCVTTGLAGIHLDSAFHATDPAPTLFGASEGESIQGGGLTWNGTQYVLGWSSSKQGVIAARIGTSGGAQSLTTISSTKNAFGVDVKPVTGGVAVGWSEDQQYFVALLRASSVDAPVIANRDESTQPTAQHLESLPDGRIAYLNSSVQPDAPHHGTTHVMMSIASLAAPQRPDEPVATVRKEDYRFRIEWTAPPQPVTGYRVEYRVGDGLWNELDRWHDPDQRALIFVPPWPDAAYSFRIRAFNEGGPGRYSFPISVSPVKRRSAR